MSEPIKLSVVVPVFNEEGSLRELCSQLRAALGGDYESHEVIFIDDGSTDSSFEILKALHEGDGRVKVLRFRRNFGQTAAMDAGFKKARGGLIVSMDADLQNDPTDIPRLIKKLGEGFDVVCGWRRNRKDPLAKRVSSKLSNIIRNSLTGEKIHDSGCSLRVYRREVLSELEIYGEMHRYIPALLTWKGFKVGEIEIEHHPRVYGKTKYSSGRLANGFLDLMFVKFWSDYSTRPLHVFGTVGLTQYVLACMIFVEQIIWALIVKVFYAGPLLLLGIMLTITGTLSIMLGFLSEILIRIYYSRTNSKFYSVRDDIS
jgi:glycosyltransferase involved in cell wall biosynthesis